MRRYERAGLLEPGRTDIVILRRIAGLLALGLNLSGIRLALTSRRKTRPCARNSRGTATLPTTRHPQTSPKFQRSFRIALRPSAPSAPSAEE
nr:hypothetical protein [Paeniglutamicibacter terrestris]